MFIGSTDVKPRVLRLGRKIARVEAVDARPRRTLAQQALETIENLRLPGGAGFDAAVRQVPHPAGEPLVYRDRLREVAEAYALHATSDHVPSRDAHLEERTIIPPETRAPRNGPGCYHFESAWSPA